MENIRGLKYKTYRYRTDELHQINLKHTWPIVKKKQIRKLLGIQTQQAREKQKRPTKIERSQKPISILKMVIPHLLFFQSSYLKN